ncbi:MAG: hypothetical protein JSU86_12340 [Phycisphaerales bacterium]|nr:MAG: hypothetical protein JSU86_12340 [Phycisphaerales bacterium]
MTYHEAWQPPPNKVVGVERIPVYVGLDYRQGPIQVYHAAFLQHSLTPTPDNGEVNPSGDKRFIRDFCHIDPGPFLPPLYPLGAM